MSNIHLGWLAAIAVWALFPIRMLTDRSMQCGERRAWALACAVAPVVAYIIFLVYRAIRVSERARAA